MTLLVETSYNFFFNHYKCLVPEAGWICGNEPLYFVDLTCGNEPLYFVDLTCGNNVECNVCAVFGIVLFINFKMHSYLLFFPFLPSKELDNEWK